MKRLAYVVSSHGFGHAARACAVIEALWERDPRVRVEIFAGTPDWFFAQSLDHRAPSPDAYRVHQAVTDVGLRQATALREDAEATRRALDELLPFDEGCRPLAKALAATGPDVVVCDISPWGLVAARRIGVPSVLVENFTWDWIYAGYPELRSYVEPFAEAFALADRRIQSEPICRPVDGARVVPPVSRRPRRDRAATRERLGVEGDSELVMVTMGGVAWRYDALDALRASDRSAGGRRRAWLVAGGAPSDDEKGGDGGVEGDVVRRGNVLLLPHRSRHYHPDLVAASDVIVAKLGYSTLAEVASARARLAYVPRPAFPESPPMERWARLHLATRRIEPEEMESAHWAARVAAHVDELSALDAGRPAPRGDTLCGDTRRGGGATRVAGEISSLEAGARMEA